MVLAQVAMHFAQAQRMLGRLELAVRYGRRATELLPELKPGRELVTELAGVVRRRRARP